jgi:flagellar motor switch protein FliN
MSDEAMPEFADEREAVVEESSDLSPQSSEPEMPEPVAEEPAPAPVEAAPPLPDLPLEEEPPVPDVPDPAEDLAEHLLDVDVRFWAELGRAELPLAEAVALGTGAIVDLDREPTEPLDVYVNGMRFATARLLLVDGEWAIRLEEVLTPSEAVEQLSSSGSGA